MDAGLAVTANIDEEPIERQFSFLPDNSDFFDKFPVIFNDSAFCFLTSHEKLATVKRKKQNASQNFGYHILIHIRLP